MRTPAGAKGKFTLNLNVAKERENGRVLDKKKEHLIFCYEQQHVCMVWRDHAATGLWRGWSRIFFETTLKLDFHKNCIILTMNSAYIFNLSFCKVLSFQKFIGSRSSIRRLVWPLVREKNFHLSRNSSEPLQDPLILVSQTGRAMFSYKELEPHWNSSHVASQQCLNSTNIPYFPTRCLPQSPVLGKRIDFSHRLSTYIKACSEFCIASEN